MNDPRVDGNTGAFVLPARELLGDHLVPYGLDVLKGHPRHFDKPGLSLAEIAPGVHGLQPDPGV